jgi:pyruvate dehydrogenase E1 component beta subunit
MPWTKVLIDKADFENTLGKRGLRGLSYRDALLEAQRQLLESDPLVFLIGEGIDDPGGVFGSTLGLYKSFPGRVLDIPIAENGLTGIAMGAALAGMRPLFIHMRVDFLPMCMDMIVNHAAKWNYMTGGRAGVPLVIRSITGKGWGSAAQHSQALHAMFAHVPGLKILLPATPYDAKGLLLAASADGNPVLCFEHRWLYDFTGYVPAEKYTVPLGKGVIRREGGHVTIVALSLMIYEAVKAARELAAEGIEAEIIDPRSIKPLDEELILSSVKKTGRLIVADTGSRTGSFACHISSVAAEKAWHDLKAPIRLVCMPDTPVPAAPALEKAYYRGKDQITAAAREICKS